MKKLLRGVKANANLHQKPPIYLLKKLLGMEDHVSKQVQEEEHLVNLYMDLTNIVFFIYLPIFIKTSHLSLLLLSLTFVLDYQDGSHLLSQPWYDMSIDKTWNIKWQTSNLYTAGILQQKTPSMRIKPLGLRPNSWFFPYV